MTSPTDTAYDTWVAEQIAAALPAEAPAPPAPTDWAKIAADAASTVLATDAAHLRAPAVELAQVAAAAAAAQLSQRIGDNLDRLVDMHARTLEVFELLAGRLISETHAPSAADGIAAMLEPKAKEPKR